MPRPRSSASAVNGRVRPRRVDWLGTVDPYLSELHAPHPLPAAGAAPPGRFTVASYNVHRWAGVRGGRAFEPERAETVLAELQADVIALQEALRPFDGVDPLAAIADRLGYYLAFVTTRIHRRGELGNALLARWPLSAAFAMNLPCGRLERRAALAAQFRGTHGPFTIAATHLALVDRTRTRQVTSLLSHAHLQEGPVVLLGDMNAWRVDGAARHLDAAFTAHDNAAWPATYPSVRPVLALDRIYARGAAVTRLRAHDSEAARRASDHLPVVATVVLERA